MRDCELCGISLSKAQKRFCSRLCLNRGIAALGGRASINKNRPVGEEHYLWKGGLARKAQWKAEYKQKYPERVKAHELVTTAVKRGKLQRTPCAQCGATKTEAHHEDYTKPLEVMWFCREHHREADKRLGIGSKDFSRLARPR